MCARFVLPAALAAAALLPTLPGLADPYCVVVSVDAGRAAHALTPDCVQVPVGTRCQADSGGVHPLVRVDTVVCTPF